MSNHDNKHNPIKPHVEFNVKLLIKDNIYSTSFIIPIEDQQNMEETILNRSFGFFNVVDRDNFKNIIRVFLDFSSVMEVTIIDIKEEE